MTRNHSCNFMLAGLAVAMLSPLAAMGQTSADLDRVSSNEKGSLLMWSKFWVEQYDNQGEQVLLADTVLQFTNDSPEAVDVQFYVAYPVYVEDEVVWRNFDVGITLTGNQPAWWSMGTGESTFAGMPAVSADADPILPYVYCGYVYAWATEASGGSENVEITHNHLSGEARFINYSGGWSLEYGAWSAARATDAGAGDATLNLDGNEYDTCFSHLLYNFNAAADYGSEGDPVQASGSSPLLNLHVVDANFDADVPGAGSYKTKAHFDIWNEYEIKLSGQYRCIDCWEVIFPIAGFGNGGPNHMLRENLGTAVGKARITSVSDSLLCEGNGDGGEYAMLGMAAAGYIMPNDGMMGQDFVTAANNLVGMGERAATIVYPLLDVPPVAPEGPVGAMDAFLGDIKKAARSSK